MKKTKIICTVGPASDNSETIRSLINAGMDVSRHNFSHGDHAEHKIRMDLVKDLRVELNKHIAIILDTKGPEIRTGNFAAGKVELKEGAKFTVVCGEEVIGDETTCSVTYNKLNEDVKPNDIILIDDGLVGLIVQEIKGKKIECIVANTGMVGNHKGVNVPGVSINLPALTGQDIEDLKFGVTQEVDIVAASFIRKASDVLDIRRILNENGGADIQIFSKIENREGVNNIDDIIKFSDGIMVARGDLGVEIPTEEVPIVQKMIIQKCNAAGKAVITATQMLDSMMRNPRPTRAESSDVANAIFDGTDAIMLSGETANGKYPVEAVTIMSKIAKAAEDVLNYEENLNKKRKSHIPNVPNAISLATCNTAMELNASAIITATQSGSTARKVSAYRPECPVIAVTPYEKVARSLALNWGVIAICAEKVESTDELIDKSVNIALKAGYVEKGDLVVMAAGIPANFVGSTNMMKVHIVGDILLQGKGNISASACGTAYYVKSTKEANDTMQDGDILVVKTLNREYIEILDRVSGIIVEEDELSSSVVIECTSREIPIIYNATGATEVIKTGSFITMDAARGIVYSGRANVKN
ncbi:pyruvate kinase [Clostridium tagluense]|uniref:pyruvate kinase n=1 Tax=Clostridium TaxID=1485 RepID=UPI0013E9789C|nr:MULTISPECIES: pyruvate kinase [Clostridium]MBU3126948.1 pyruvate kinase [Clostridium tagluense]MBZ9625391.1 pyruvate kinase [Clostridium sp. FP2]MCB2313572.1 pyruvate kinase [Clostridium tagluense]MCB2318436.1 pyruvate kinase [Clostridium tagluense]MCB2323237.1 pyruvate kinase [Clostridium tagluense]